MRLGEIVIRNGGVVISDEIHCEILFQRLPAYAFCLDLGRVRPEQHRVHGAE